jgi:DNA-binding LytR/AlgR family response regulator
LFGGKTLKVDINISKEVKEPYVVIHTNEMTNEISELANSISEMSAGSSGGRIIGNVDDRMIVLEADTISVIRVDSEKVYVVSDGVSYRVNRRMYELLEILGKDFMQVSKSASINLKYLKSVEPYFNGVMVLNLKDGEKEYISRKYVPALKKYLGI